MRIREITKLAGCVAGALLITLSGTVGQETRGFTNTAGKTIQAELISATETEVTIKTSSGKEYTLELTKLVEEDQKFINTWRAENPEAAAPKVKAVSKLELDYRFVKKKTGTKKLGKKQSVSTWLYEVELSNKSREAVPALTVKYEMFINYDSKYAEKKRGLARTLEGEYKLKGVEPQGRLAFKTMGVPVQEDKSRTLNGDIVTVVQYEEDLVGVILNFYQGEKKVGTHSHGRTKRD